jgi:hypothetical protein
MQTLKRFPNPRLTNKRIIRKRNNASNPNKASVLEPHRQLILTTDPTNLDITVEARHTSFLPLPDI